MTATALPARKLLLRDEDMTFWRTVEHFSARRAQNAERRQKTLEANSDLLVEGRNGKPLPVLKHIAMQAAWRVSEKPKKWFSDTSAARVRNSSGHTLGNAIFAAVVDGALAGAVGQFINLMLKITSDTAAMAIGAAAGVLLVVINVLWARIEFCNDLRKISGELRDSIRAITREQTNLARERGN